MIKIKDKTISTDSFIVIAGPCTIDSKEQLEDTAAALSNAGINLLRGGAFKMRTSPRSWQGLGREGLQYLREAGQKYGMITVSEIVAETDLQLMAEYADILLIGTRNMQNYPLLKAVGKTSQPVILKRGMGNTIEEWIEAGNYILQEGNKNLIFCERGIRTFETCTRHTLDLSAVPIMKKMTTCPVIVDPSHGTGRADLIRAMSWAAAAAGADGLMIECDVQPQNVRCDARQTIDIAELKAILEKLPQVLQLWGKTIL